MSNYEECEVIKEFRSLSTISLEKSSTHVELFGDNIPRSMTKQNAKSFLLYYSSFLISVIEEEYDDDILPIGEVVGKYAPVMVSLKECRIINEEGGIKSSALETIVQTVQTSLRTLGNPKSPQIFDNSLLHCMVLTRDNPDADEDDLTCDVILAFPGAVEATHKIITEFYPSLDEEFRKLSKKKKEMNFGFDRKFYSNPIPLYMSGEESESYKIISIAPYSASSSIDFTDIDRESLIKHFPMEQMNLFRSGIFDRDDLKELDSIMDNAEALVPLYLSHYGVDRITSNKLINQSISCCPSFTIKGFMDNDKLDQVDVKDEGCIMDIIEEFADMMDASKLDSEEEWKMIGEAISNAVNGEESGMIKWKEIVDKMLVKYFKVRGTLPYYLRQENLKRGETIEYKYSKTYSAFPIGRITIVSLADAANHDSPVRYDNWKMKWCKAALMSSVNSKDVSLAKAFYRLNFTEHFCDILSNDRIKWYMVRNNRLFVDHGGATIMKKMTEEFRLFFLRMKTQVTKDLETADTERSLYGKDLLGKIDGVIEKLQSITFLGRILTAAKIYFNRTGVSTFFDENPDITCCISCVIVSSSGGLYSRPGRLEDFITKSTSARYPEHFNRINPETGKPCGWDDPAVKILMEWSKQTFCAREEFEGGSPKEVENMESVKWWWKLQASGFRGGNDDKIFPAMYGPKGNEGKSAWVWQITKAWGELASKVDTNYFTKDSKDPNAATPVTAGLKGVRWIFVEESEDTKPFLAGIVKKRTGKDTTRARGNFQDGGVMTIQGTFIVVTNDLPPFTNSGSAVVERFIVISIVSQRSSDAPETIDEQYRLKKFFRDNTFDRDVEYQGAAFLWLSSVYFREYQKEGLRNFPKKFEKATKRYWEEKDKYFRFVTEVYEATSSKEDKVSLTDAYEEFVMWFERRYPKKPIPNIDDVHRELKNKWGKPQNDTWSSVRRRDGDECDEGRLDKKKAPAIRPVHGMIDTF